MDNLTHTVIGLIAGEALAQSVSMARSGAPAAGAPAQRATRGRRAVTDGERRGLLIAAFAIGGNLPDLDLLVSYRGFGGDKLDYLLQHRGYTHTIVGCIALGLLLYGALELLMRGRGLSPRPNERRWLLFAALSGTLLHLAMDFLNSYGVHPFWPFDNRWYYGDSVFIVEPLYWIAAAPLLFVQRSWPAQAFIVLVVGLAIVLSVLTRGLVPTPIIVVALALAVILFALGARLAAPAVAFASLAACLGVTAVFIASGAMAVALSQRLAGAPFSAATGGDAAHGLVLLTDHVLTPMPANPFCWDAILVQEQQGRMRMRHAVLAIAPQVLTAEECPRGLAGGAITAPLQRVSQSDTDAVRWLGELDIPAGAFAKLAATSCEASAFMRFARAPFLRKVGTMTVLGDLRFDREPALGFAELSIGDAARSGDACPPTPPWLAPRAELLR